MKNIIIVIFKMVSSRRISSSNLVRPTLRKSYKEPFRGQHLFVITSTSVVIITINPVQ